MAFGYDPQYSAFLRAMGVEEQAIRADARQAGNLARRQFTRQAPRFDDRILREAEGIRNDAETRGVFRSGATVNALARSRGDIELERAEAGAALRDQLQSLQLGAQTRVASLRRQALEGGLEARTRATDRAAQARYGRGGSFYR